MFKITDIDDKEHGYVCYDPSDVFDVILRITKSEKDAKDAMTIAKMMGWYDNYICFNKYTIERMYRIDEKYKRILSRDELETMLRDAYENGMKHDPYIYQCEYCDGGKALVTGKTNDQGITMQYPNRLIAYGYDIHGTGSNGLVARINYCPMCGKKMKGERYERIKN